MYLTALGQTGRARPGPARRRRASIDFSATCRRRAQSEVASPIGGATTVAEEARGDWSVMDKKAKTPKKPKQTTGKGTTKSSKG
jgi:hypothetical protein